MTTNLSPKEKLAENYADKRVIELLSMDKESLAKYIIGLEVELMDISDSVLDDNYPDMAVHGVQSNLDRLDNDALRLMKDLDKVDEESDLELFHALWKYRTV
ncbi:hypothetical protein [Streptococcus pluranimalium]|nr:hypothetical protein [Streptococcus suis]